MAGVLNTTARQFNLKCMDKDGKRVVVRLVPGLNEVKDEHWNAFCKPKMNPYVEKLVKDGHVKHGKSIDEKLEDLDEEPVKSKSKSEPVKKGKAQ